MSEQTGIGVYGLAGAPYSSYPAPSGEFALVGRSVTTSGYGIEGYAPGTSGGAGVYGNATGTGGTGVYGSGYAYGVHGYSSREFGVFGEGYASGYSAVAGFGTSGAHGVYGYATGTSYGVYGLSNNDAGHFVSTGSGHDGVWASGGYAGVYATGSSYGIDATCTGGSCIAGNFVGEVDITNCTKIDGSTYGTCTSDRRLKRNITPIGSALNDLLRLKPVTYEWIDPSRGTGTQTGFIAQDVEQVRPDWVTTGDDGYKRIHIGNLPTLIVAAVQTISSEDDHLEERIEAMEDGRRPMVSRLGQGWLGAGVLALGAALVLTRRRRQNEKGTPVA